MATTLMSAQAAMHTKSFLSIASPGNGHLGVVEAGQAYVGLRKSVTLRNKSPSCQRAAPKVCAYFSFLTLLLGNG